MPGMIESEKLNALVQNIIKHKIATEFSMNLTLFRIEVSLDKKKMRDLKITEVQLEKTIEEEMKKVKISFAQDKLIIKPKAEEYELRILYQLMSAWFIHLMIKNS